MATFQETTTLPYTGREYKIPGYTGYIPGVQETFKKGPIPSQLECKAPDQSSFIYTRTEVAPKSQPARDPCNDHSNFLKAQPGNMWPALQASATQEPFRPPGSCISLGDLRVDVFSTSYNQDFKAPFDDHERLRSPNRNLDLIKTISSLKDHYYSAYNRVGDKRLQKIISTMRERLEAKMGNCNNNGFKFRKLFQMFDKNKTGQVHYEDFRNMCETFGMQLDDDCLLALFYVYDPEGTGYLSYHDLTKQLMDPDCYALYVNDVDLSQTKADEVIMTTQLKTVKGKFGQMVPDLLQMLKGFDKDGSEYLDKHDITGACASLGLVLTSNEFVGLTAGCTDSAGRIHYPQFCSNLST
jgi:Ca2+-binding EF-hand superfamily protein